MNNSAQDSWVRGVTEMAPRTIAGRWTHFLHLTFHRPASLDYANRSFGEFISKLEAEWGGTVNWFVVFERNTVENGYHLHGLLSSAVPISWAHLGLWRHGSGDVEPYDPSQRGLHYILKLANLPDLCVPELDPRIPEKRPGGVKRKGVTYETNGESFTKRIDLRVSQSLLEEIDQLSNRLDLSRGAFLRRAARTALEAQLPQDAGNNGERREPIQFMVSPSTVEALDSHAQSLGTTRSGLIRQGVGVLLTEGINSSAAFRR